MRRVSPLASLTRTPRVPVECCWAALSQTISLPHNHHHTMARSKQQRTPAPSRSTTTGTSTAAVSPVFSNMTSSQPTPATSDIDIDVSKSVGWPKRVTRASSGGAAKRPAAGTEDDSDNSDPIALPSKRRVLSRTVYVEVPTVKGARKAQPKVRIVLSDGEKKRN